MTIIFNPEPDNTLSALSFDAVWKGFCHQELYWADLKPALGGWMVQWNDAYYISEHFDTLEKAKEHITQFYSSHNPHSNANKYEL